MAQPPMAASLSRLRFWALSAQSVRTFTAPLTARAQRRPEMPWNGVCHSCFQRLFSASPSAAGGSSSRWKMRQHKDRFTQEAKVQGLKSRAAFKLLEMDAKYRIFKTGQTVVDLVALERTKPGGRILGIDLIPAQPPRGVSTIQGNFLSPAVRSLVKELLVAGSPKPKIAPVVDNDAEVDNVDEDDVDAAEAAADKLRSAGIVIEETSYIDLERQQASSLEAAAASMPTGEPLAGKEKSGRLVDLTPPKVVLSDMSEPWPQTYGFWLNTLSNPYYRMMNTSGVTFRDHAGSMDLCNAALEFASDTLRPGGHFVCKFYQGGEDKAFEKRLRKIFSRVFREKPESSRSESKEAYFVALRRKGHVTIQELEKAS